jgi:hypothetical protein
MKPKMLDTNLIACAKMSEEHLSSRRNNMQARARTRKVQTTLRLPRPLYEQAKAYVSKGETAAETINDFIVAAIQTYTRILKRRSIDAEFSRMAGDANYQKESQLIAEEFAHSDWEALEAALEPEEAANATR